MKKVIYEIHRTHADVDLRLRDYQNMGHNVGKHGLVIGQMSDIILLPKSKLHTLSHIKPDRISFFCDVTDYDRDFAFSRSPQVYHRDVEMECA